MKTNYKYFYQILDEKNKKRYKSLFKTILQHWQKLFFAMVCMLVVAASTALSAYLVKPMLDDIFVNRDNNGLLFIPIAAITLFLLKGIATYGQNYLMSYVGEKVIKSFRDSLYEKIIDLPLFFFNQEKIGALMSRITNDVNIVRGMVSNAVTSVLRDFFTVVGLICVIFYMDWKLAVWAFLILPAAFYPIIAFGRRVRRFSTGCQDAMADINVFLHQTFSGIKIVKIFTMESYEKKRFNDKTDKLFKLEMKSVIAKSLSSPVMEFLGGVGIAFIIWFGGSRVINGVSTTGTFFSFLTAVMMLYDPVKKLSSLNNSIQEGLAAVARIYDIIDQPDEYIENNPKVNIEKAVEPIEINFNNVFFKYSYDKDSSWVLENINLNVKQGEIVAFVGTSGGGKTSLVNLIPRFYNITNGNITIDNKNIKQNIRDIPLSVLRKKISIVTQEPILFNETIRDNISYGRIDALDSEIENAARSAYAHDFIIDFPKGYDTLVGELGNRLSGGEKQRICIARALIKDAPILILDEATSALDVESEKIVQKALINLMKGRTTFIIAHRLSTIADADKIIVINKGKIVEQGTHEELIVRGGEYFKMYHINDKTIT